MDAVGVNGVLCLKGVSAGEKRLEVCADCINMSMVLGNKVVFGTVSSNPSHFEIALSSLAEIERKWPHWLERLIIARLTLDDLDKALESPHDRIKTVIQMSYSAFGLSIILLRWIACTARAFGQGLAPVTKVTYTPPL